MKIYLDEEYKCHVADGGGMREVETDFFDGKCAEYVEGFRFLPSGESWTREDGVIFYGEMISAWKRYAELAAAQTAYELADLRTALEAIYGGETDE